MAAKYGLFLGLFMIVVTVIFYVINIELLAKWWLGIILFLVIIGVGIASSIKARKLLNGFISFKGAFSSYFTTVVVAVLLSSIFSIILFNVIDPEASDIIKERIIETSTQMMENFGAPQTEIDKAVAQMQEQNQFSVVSQLKSLAWQFLFYAIIGLIVALAIKKTDPNAA